MPITLDELAAMLESRSRECRPALGRDLVEAGELVKKHAQEMIGHEHASWPPLKPETIAEKARLGYPTPAPLLRTGILRESIDFEVTPVAAEGFTLIVGSEDKVAAYQEMGTSKIPPRPFISTSAIQSLPVIQERLSSLIVGLLTPTGKIP